MRNFPSVLRVACVSVIVRNPPPPLPSNGRAVLRVSASGCVTNRRCSFLTGPNNRRDVHMLFPEEEKIIVEEIRSNGQTVVEER